MTQLPGLRDLFYAPIIMRSTEEITDTEQETKPAEDSNSLKLYRVVYNKTHRLLNP